MLRRNTHIPVGSKMKVLASVHGPKIGTVVKHVGADGYLVKFKEGGKRRAKRNPAGIERAEAQGYADGYNTGKGQGRALDTRSLTAEEQDAYRAAYARGFNSASRERSPRAWAPRRNAKNPRLRHMKPSKHAAGLYYFKVLDPRWARLGVGFFAKSLAAAKSYAERHFGTRNVRAAKAP